jgi:eukaryotic-like serine/threonine-protein kinase
MTLSAGSRLGAYEIAGLIGAGGMGEVYRARDTRLKRDVALKILPDSFATDPERLARFQREAEVLASLNHSRIAAIYGLEESDASPGSGQAVRALVMELVEGPTLADRIAQGPIPVDDALSIARQIAEALEAAHEQGIIHRDLKPANIKVRPDGTVKVLDFGLAKALDPAGVARDVSQSPTITSPALMTGVGTLLGTAAYMSPEQAKGRRADRRSDIWAFGCVLYEMLTGKPAFGGDDVADTLAAVLRGEPDWSALPPSVSPTLRTYLRRCLSRDPAQRVHDVADMRLAIEGAFDVPLESLPSTPAVRTPALRRRRLLVYVAGAVALAAVASLLGSLTARRLSPPTPVSVVRLTATPLSADPILPTTTGLDIAVSPDGSRIAYVNVEQGSVALYVRRLDQLAAVQIQGLSGAAFPFFSADGESIGFFEGGFLKRVSASGGPAITITAINGTPYGGSWGSNGVIVFTTSDSTGLMRVPATGGEPTELTKPGKGEDHALPEILPGGRAVLFTIRPQGSPISNGQIAALDLQSGAQKILVSGGGQARYAISGHLVYGFAGTLRAVGFDLGTLTVRGNPVPVVDRVVTKASGPANFAISSNGLLVYESGDALSTERTLVWVNREGREEPLPAPKRSYTYPRISPDGRRIALDIRDQENDIWMWDVARQTLTRLTFDQGLNRGIAWTPDGRRLAFSAERDGAESVFWQAADGTGAPEVLTKPQPTRPQIPFSFSPDGARLIYGEPGNPPFDLYLLNLAPEPKATPLLPGPRNEHNAEISPDGRWLAYESDESGSAEVYVRPFPNVGDGRWQVSIDGGRRPAWARDGRELFYLKVDGTMIAVPIESGGGREGLAAGIPRTLFKGPYFMVNAGRTYDVAADGRRFLMIKSAAPAGSSSAPQLVVVLNWGEELKRLVPAK